MKKSVAITISDERLAALEMYLEQKNIKLSDEIDKCIDGLYQKNVPSNSPIPATSGMVSRLPCSVKTSV